MHKKKRCGVIDQVQLGAWYKFVKDGHYFVRITKVSLYNLYLGGIPYYALGAQISPPLIFLLVFMLILG